MAETQNRVKVAYEGECKIAPEPVKEPTPAPVKEPAPSAAPAPAPTTAVCPKDYAPVCGANDITYTNKCFAEEAKVSVAYSGECKVAAPTPPPTAECSKDYFPVCGTDNKTYNNSCYAKQAGVGAQYSGECKIVTSPPPMITYQCSDGIDNDKDGYIDLKDPGCTDSKDNDETNAVTSPKSAPPEYMEGGAAGRAWLYRGTRTKPARRLAGLVLVQYS